MIKPSHLPLNIILLGDPAAGKATQSALLLKKYRLRDFDMGKELTLRRKSNKALDRLLRSYSDKGKLTPTRVVREILDEVIHKVPATQGILFDGHPKMVGEARLIRKWLRETGRSRPLVIYLTVPLQETIKRMVDRVGYFSGKYGKRPDDTEKALSNRRKYYRDNIAEVVKFLRAEYDFVQVSGLGSVASVHDRIAKSVDKYAKQLISSNHLAKRARRRTNE